MYSTINGAAFGQAACVCLPVAGAGAVAKQNREPVSKWLKEFTSSPHLMRKCQFEVFPIGRLIQKPNGDKILPQLDKILAWVPTPGNG